MGQIIGGAAKPKRCNKSKLSQLGTPAAGEYILVSSDNSMNASGQGNFDCYIVGDGHTAATALPLENIMPSGVFDLSVYTGSTYADLAAALNAMNAIPAAYKKSGTSIKFVQSSDNKYVQYRLMANSWSIDTNEWSFCGDDLLVENPEWAKVIIDTNNNILAGIKKDGEIYWAKGLPKPLKDYIDGLIETINENLSTLNDDVDMLQNKTEHISEITNEQYIKVVLDNDEHVIRAIDENGKELHFTENVFLKAPSLSNEAMVVFQQWMRDEGYSEPYNDHSNLSSLIIPIPRLAKINITNDYNNAKIPTSKTDDKEYWLEFWDMSGNYFKKRIICNLQGASSLTMPKKNISIDLCNDEWIGDDTFSVKFGDWVPQDSFHLKAFWSDYFRGLAMVGYELYNQIDKCDRNIINNRIWKRALLNKTTIGSTTTGLSDEDIAITVDSGARCYPDGFPCAVYFNGRYYGLYVFALKKHRDNYMQDKKTAKHIQLDGFINPIFLMNGTLNWPIINGTESVPGTENHDGIEIRNPKNIICIDGTKYDGDDNRQELIDSNSANYDSSNKDHVRSNKVKGYLTTLSTYVPTLQSMEEQGATAEAIRAKISECFDVETLIDYLIFGDVVDNWDGYGKNWQWTTYDGVKWFVNPYDLDGILGWTGWAEHAPNYTSSVIGTSKNYPTGWVYAYYFEELKARYAILRQKNVISAENISNILVSWTYRIGDALYAKDLKKWPMTPEEYSGLSSEHFDNVYRVYNWVEEKISICDTRYNYNIN